MLHKKRFALWFSLSISHIYFSIHNVKVANILWFLKKLFSFLAALLHNLIFNFYMNLIFNVYRVSGSCLVIYSGISVDVKIRGWLFNKMVFFAFHQYLNFHWIFFFVGNYSFVLFATWNDVSIYLVSNISQVILVFTFCEFLCCSRNKPQYFTFMLRKPFI